MDDFEEIYHRYFDDVYRYIRRLSGNEHIAEEITSETFFKALKSVKKFRGDCDMRVWLCQIAKNCYRSYLKKQRHTSDIDDAILSEIPDDSENVENAVISRDDALRIKRILHEIPEPYKEVFLWRTLAELSFKQIGQIFQKSENWACVTYHRARKMIIERMEEEK